MSSELWFQPQSALWPPERNSEEIVWRVDIKIKKNIEAVSSDCISADAFSSPLSLFQLSQSSSLMQSGKAAPFIQWPLPEAHHEGQLRQTADVTHMHKQTHTLHLYHHVLLLKSFSHTHLHTHALHPYLSSSSSMYPLLSWSRTVNTFLLSASDKPVSPTCSKNDLKLNVPGATLDHVHTDTHIVERGREEEKQTHGNKRSITQWQERKKERRETE